jgi:RNA polymerase sigma-70 factor (ECF subfamily)
MLSEESRAPGVYRVLVNSDEQLVAWPDCQPVPFGWEATGVTGTQAECIAHIEGRWTSHETLQPENSELALLEQLRRGDEAAFGALVDRHHASFVRLALGYVRDRSIAEEVAQEAWLGIVRGLHQFAGRASFKTWMFRILVNCAKRRAVRESRSIAISEQWDTAEDSLEPAVPPEWFRGSGDQWPGGWLVFPGDWGDEPERRLMADETRREIDAMIERLPIRQRQILVLRDVDGLSASEVCETLQLSEANQRVLLHRARSSMRRFLSDHLLRDDSAAIRLPMSRP